MFNMDVGKKITILWSREKHLQPELERQTSWTSHTHTIQGPGLFSVDTQNRFYKQT